MAFHPIDRDTDYLLPPSVQEWLPEAHLARYVVDVVEGLDLSALERAYAGRGSDAYHPAMLLSLLIYGYATGTFSSRKIERASYDSLAFRYIVPDRKPRFLARVRLCVSRLSLTLSFVARCTGCFFETRAKKRH